MFLYNIHNKLFSDKSLQSCQNVWALSLHLVNTNTMNSPPLTLDNIKHREGGNIDKSTFVGGK